MTEFHAVFQITRLVLFNVDYYTLGNNRNPYFATSAMKYIRSKRDICEGGQCQETVLPVGAARNFYKKWDHCHLKDLSKDEYSEMREDLQILMDRYNYILVERETFAHTNYDIPSSDEYELSMRPLKKAARKTA